MIDLAAGAWGISQSAAMRKLRDEGVPIPEELLDENAEYSFSVVKRRRQATDLWRRSNAQLDDMTRASRTIRMLRDRLCLTTRIGDERWRAGPAKMFGAATQAQLQDALLAPGAVNNFRRNNGGLIFRAAGWRDVLMFPYFSAPANLQGFHFVGRDGTPNDHLYRPVIARTGPGYSEGGLFGLDTIAASKHFAGYVFAIDDAILATKLQIRHAAHSVNSLPLVAWYDRQRIRTYSAWFAVERPLIFWGYRLTPSLVANAAICDAKIAIVPLMEVNKTSVEHHLRSAAPEELFRRAIRQAKPWRDALALWAKEHGHAAIEDLLLRLQTYTLDHEMITQVLDAPATLRKTPMRHVRVGDFNYIERATGWSRACLPGGISGRIYSPRPQEQPVSDTIIRFDYVSSGPQAKYVGRFIRGDRTAPFVCPIGRVSQLKQLCIQAGLGVPTIHVVPSTLEKVAVAFQAPQLVSPEAIDSLVDIPVVRPSKALNAKSRVPKS